MPTAAPPPKPARRGGAAPSLVDARIKKTRTAVKTADIATGAGLLLAWSLVVLLVAAMADHWLVAGGLDRGGRAAIFAVAAIGAGVIIWKRLTPAIAGRVNPLYAAREIERESPQLKNALLNLLQLRDGAAPAAVRRTLERQAAERLATAGDAPIDHTPLVRVAQLLMVLVGLIGLYVVLSPKDFFASAGRVLAPWSEIAAPSRVRITDVEPGDTTLSQGEKLQITATVSGLAPDEIAEVVYTTADAGVVDRRVPMRSGSGRVLHEVTLPPGGSADAALGLQGDLAYRLEAGDARTPWRQVRVLAAPTIAPVSIAYDYPDYTGLTDRVTSGGGDIRAIEGTRVTLEAEANLPIADARIDLGADGRPDVVLRPEGSTATGRWTLRHSDGAGPIDSKNYVLRFTSADDQANVDPPRYRVEVIADLPPEVAITAPEEEITDVPLDGSLRVAGEARDPDFELQSVRLVGTVGGRKALNRELPEGRGRGLRRLTSELSPRELGLSPGDVLEYRLVAADNRSPEAGVGQSESRRLRVVGGDRQQRDQRGGQGQAGEGQADQGQPQQGQPQQGQPQPGAGGKQGEQQDQQAGQQGDQQQQAGEPQEGQQGQEAQQGQDAKPSEPGDQQQDAPPQNGLRGPGEADPNAAPQDNAAGAQGEGQGDSQQQADQPANGSRQGQPQQRPDAGTNQDPQPTGEPGKPQGDGQPGADPAAPSEPDPVAPDGSDDGAAFERIREFLENQPTEGRQGEQSPPPQGQRQPPQANDQPPQANDQRPQPSDQAPQAKQQPQGDTNGQTAPQDPAQPPREQPGAQEQRPDQQANPDATGRPASPDAQQQPRDSQAQDSPAPPDQGQGPGENDRSGQQSDSQSSESGGDTPPGEASDSRPTPRQGTGGSGQNEAADRGAGQSGDQGAGDTTGRPGEQQQSDTPSGESGGPQGETGRESQQGRGEERPGQGPSGDGSSAGEESTESQRDRTGGGGEAGQSGDTSAAPPAGDDRSKSSQQRAGDQQRDPQPAGDPEAADPSSPSGGAAGDSPGDEATDANQESDPTGDPPRPKPRAGQQGREGDQQPSGGAGQGLQGAGQGSEVGGDKANLEYAREQTELVLERLEDQLQREQVDRELLDELGWSQDDLERFVDRWQSRRQRAQQRGPEGRAELDRALRGLGLSPGGPSVARDKRLDDLRDLSERTRTAPPPGLQDAMRRFQQSVNRIDEGE
ncbi:hypothetical protein [Botrimarina sp.]|uniref:hypothetical protein n=1 Tax=Botrimarina sp. TaxID=2795802 RepID=UPI0032EC5788